MNNVAIRPATRPIKMNVTRIQQIFENTNPYIQSNAPIIKDYVYSAEKRVIA